MRDYRDSNRTLWNAWTRRDLRSDHHRAVAAFRAGKLTVRSIEREALGDVYGRTLLHLQCNMGSDTLSWARLGATVTGVDISDSAIEQARALAAESGLTARFLQSDIYALPDVLDEQFDIVIATYGALCWLPDLTRWAKIVARYLRPGGIFLLVDMHPCSITLDAVSADGLALRVNGSYFHTEEPRAEAVRGLPGEGAMDMPDTVYIWHYSVGEVVTALAEAGLRIVRLAEYPITYYQQFPCLVRGEDDWWRWPSPENTLPMLFAVTATKPG